MANGSNEFPLVPTRYHAPFYPSVSFGQGLHFQRQESELETRQRLVHKDIALGERLYKRESLLTKVFKTTLYDHAKCAAHENIENRASIDRTERIERDTKLQAKLQRLHRVQVQLDFVEEQRRVLSQQLDLRDEMIESLKEDAKREKERGDSYENRYNYGKCEVRELKEYLLERDRREREVRNSYEERSQELKREVGELKEYLLERDRKEKELRDSYEERSRELEQKVRELQKPLKVHNSKTNNKSKRQTHQEYQEGGTNNGFPSAPAWSEEFSSSYGQEDSGEPDTPVFSWTVNDEEEERDFFNSFDLEKAKETVKICKR